MATGTLTSTTIASTYKSLLKVKGGANQVLEAGSTAHYLEDGDGNDSVLSLSQAFVGIGNEAPLALLSVGAITTLVTDGTTAVTPEGMNVHITEASKYAMGIKNADASGDGLLIQAGDAADDFALRVEDYDSANDLLVVQGGGSVGIGTASPDRLLHLHTGTAGTITGHANAPLVIETAGDTNIQLLAPNTSDEFILFGSNSGNRTYIQVDLSATAANESFQIYTNSALAFKLDANSRVSLSNNDSGGGAGFNSTTGNTTFGYLAGEDIASGGVNNTMFGHQAGTDTSIGDYNSYIGARAGYANTIGQFNVAIGGEVLNADVVGDGSVGIGLQSLFFQVSDSNNERTGNVAVGMETGYYNVTGTNNTYLGYHSGLGASGQSNSNNTAVGSNSLLAIKLGASNTAVGKDALIGDDYGNHSTAIGHASLYKQNTAGTSAVGIGNTAVGSYSGYYNVTGVGNTHIGFEAGFGADVDGGDGQTNNNNTSVGYKALNLIRTGANNTAVGKGAGGSLTSGGGNTLIGLDAAHHGVLLSTGGNNTIIGDSSNTSAINSGGQIVIGADVTGVADNTVTFGFTSSTASLGLDGSDTSWAAASDERYKENIEASTAGLSFVNDLRPVIYNWKKEKDVPVDMPDYREGSDNPVRGREYGKTLHGFIAQEVKTVIDNHSEIKEGFGMWQEYENGVQSIADGNLVPMLVKAVQELSEKVKALEDA